MKNPTPLLRRLKFPSLGRSYRQHSRQTQQPVLRPGPCRCSCFCTESSHRRGQTGEGRPLSRVAGGGGGEITEVSSGRRRGKKLLYCYSGQIALYFVGETAPKVYNMFFKDKGCAPFNTLGALRLLPFS